MTDEFKHGYEEFLLYHAAVFKVSPGVLYIADDFITLDYETKVLRDFWKNLEPYVVNRRQNED